ncbi:hypothetical protein C8R47DRAFT_1075017 [Mycena vitilis]|nr:hypothetical protein C8R47DRAFT_1075017 [Mycena vitilis]
MYGDELGWGGCEVLHSPGRWERHRTTSTMTCFSKNCQGRAKNCRRSISSISSNCPRSRHLLDPVKTRRVEVKLNFPDRSFSSTDSDRDPRSPNPCRAAGMLVEGKFLVSAQLGDWQCTFLQEEQPGTIHPASPDPTFFWRDWTGKYMTDSSKRPTVTACILCHTERSLLLRRSFQGKFCADPAESGDGKSPKLLQGETIPTSSRTMAIWTSNLLSNDPLHSMKRPTPSGVYPGPFDAYGLRTFHGVTLKNCRFHWDFAAVQTSSLAEPTT